MVLLGNISALCMRYFCCKSQTQKSSPDPEKSTSESLPTPIWTTDIASYDATSTITALEAMSTSRTGIINHNFQPPGTKPNCNLPDVTAATLPATFSTFCPQGQLCDGQQCFQKTTQDAWYFSGSFTEEPRKSNEVTEL